MSVSNRSVNRVLSSILIGAVAPLRSAVREIRHLPDRAAHASRRAVAQRRLVACAPIKNALFICHGNVCRSPFAAYVFARRMKELRLPVDVRSAGFIGPDRESPPKALSAAARRGLNMTAHRSQLITNELLRISDLIVVMSVEQVAALGNAGSYGPGQVVILGDVDPGAIERRTVLDPWGGEDELFDQSYDRIERCVNEMVRVLTAAFPRR